MKILPPSFYAQPTLIVAREILGARLVRILDGTRLSGMITEAEAYIGEEDQACHARAGRTKRNAVMYAQPGHAYVYFTYGMHWMLNAVTDKDGFPAAVLIRAIEVLEGREIVVARRHGRDTKGPAKVTQALGIDSALNGANLCDPNAGLWIEEGEPVPPEELVAGPRVGLFSVPEPWKSKPWRFQMVRR